MGNHVTHITTQTSGNNLKESKGRVQKPQAWKLSVGGPPRTRIFRKVSGKKLTEKGGTPPPSTDDPFPKTEIFSPKTAIFAQKTPFLSQFFMDFFLTEKGGTPPPPRTVGSRKPNGKKLTEKGGTPLHGKFPCRGFLKPSLNTLADEDVGENAQ